MYGGNFPSKFRTSADSKYVVEDGWLMRYKMAGKKDDGLHQGAKNIFYATAEIAHVVLHTSHKHFKVQTKEGVVYITFDRTPASPLTVQLVREPRIGLTPVDMFLNHDGTPQAGHRFHVGHEIVRFLN